MLNVYVCVCNESRSLSSVTAIAAKFAAQSPEVCVQMDKLLQQIYNFLIVTAVQRIWKSEHIANP